MFMTNVMNCCVYSYLIDWLVGKLISKNTLDNRFNESMGELFPTIVIFLTYSTLTCEKVSFFLFFLDFCKLNSSFGYFI